MRQAHHGGLLAFAQQPLLLCAIFWPSCDLFRLSSHTCALVSRRGLVTCMMHKFTGSGTTKIQKNKFSQGVTRQNGQQ